jgi:hypothetical protein
MRSAPDNPSLSGTPARALEREPALVAGSLEPFAGTDLIVLALMSGRTEPLTPRRVARISGLPAAEVDAALVALNSAGLLRRLNTVITSFVARA